MTEWASHDNPSCKNSPITLSTKVKGSSNCGATVTPVGHTQSYATHANAVHAWTVQIKESFAKPIRDAIGTGNPFQISDRAPVVAALKHWGSPGFAAWYTNATDQGTTGSGGNPSTKAPHTHSGYHDLQHTWQHNLPAALDKSGRLTQAALRHLGRAHKVKG